MTDRKEIWSLEKDKIIDSAKVGVERKLKEN